MLEHAAIAPHYLTIVTEIAGASSVERVRTRHVASGEEFDVELAAVFPYIGREPETAFLRGSVPVDESGRVAVDGWMRSAVPGIFAVGDVRQDSPGQAVTGAGDGATAAIAAHRYVSGGTWR